MEIEGRKIVDNLNKQVFKGSNKDTPDKNEVKQVEASAAEAQDSYGRAMISQSQNPKAILFKLIAEAIKNYKEKLDCDADRKEQFISELKEKLTNLKENFKSIEISNNNLNNYLFKGYIEDDMKLVKELLDAKDTYGYFRFDIQDIISILEIVTPDNQDIFPILLDAKDNYGDYRFDGNDISGFLYRVKPENKDSLSLLIDAQDDEGNFRFDGNDIYLILKNVKTENKDILPLLIDAKDTNGKFRFKREYISSVLENAGTDEKDILSKLLDAQDNVGNFRFKEDEISSIIRDVNSGNIDLLNTLLYSKDTYGYLRFNGDEISSIFSDLTPKNKDIISMLVNAVNTDGNFRFKGYEIKSIFNRIKPENTELFNTLFHAKNTEGRFRFDGSDIGFLLIYLNSKNIDLFNTLFDAKDTEGKFRFDGNNISSLLRDVNPKNTNLFNTLFDAKDTEGKFRFDGYNISSLIKEVNSENINLFNTLFDAKDTEGKFRFGGKDISDILYLAEPKNKDILLKLIGAKDTEGNFRFSGKDIYSILLKVRTENQEILIKLLDAKDDEGNFRFDGENITNIIKNVTAENKEFIIKLLDAKDNEYFNKTDNYKASLFEHPELYVNGEYDDISEMKKEITSFFKNNIVGLILLSYSFDKETMDILFRKRLEDVQEYIETILSFNSEDIQLLKDLCNSLNINNKPFLPEQKINFIDLINGYKINNLSMDKIQEMIKAGIIDTNQLNVNLYKGILRNCDLTYDEISQISPEKLLSWDIQYTPLLSKEILSSNDDVFKDLLKAANFCDFKEYILNESNIYGKTNANTKNMFNNYKMNYDAWFNPSEENYVHFKTKDKNLENLSQIVEQFIEDIETLRKTPAKGFIDKQLIKFIKEDNFIIPREYVSSKANLQEFINNIFKQLEPVFKRAQSNLNNPQKAQAAQNTLTIKDHLKQRINDISEISDIKSTKTLDLTIKMWDRVPQKDIFQGNYSTCCIGMGGENGSAMPHYLMNSAYNMIELVDNVSGKTIANALCYFVTDENNKPALIIDNIEIRNSQKTSNEIGVELRSAILEYASNVAFEVTGSNDTKIYMSSNFNDVPIDDLKNTEKTINFLGDMECDDIYMDLYDGWVDKTDIKQKLSMLELK